MKDFIQKLRSFATTLAALAGAILLVSMGISGKPAPPNFDGRLTIEADINMSRSDQARE